MPTQTRVDERIEALLGEERDAVFGRERNALDELLAAHSGRIVIVGAGSTGIRALKCLRSIGVEPLAIADNNVAVQGADMDGLRVLSPKDAASRYGSNAVFLVAIWNAKHWYTDTASQLRNLGCENVVPVSAIYWRFAETFLPFFCQDLPHKVLEDREKVVRASALWSDDQSRLEYLAHVRWRAHGDWALPTRPKQESYFADDIFDLIPDESVVDCGAFDGDTVRSILARCGENFRHIDAIEPSPQTCDQLRAYVSTLSPTQQQKISVYQCAVGAESGSVRFDATSGLDAHIAEDGGVVVELRTLDTLCRASRPTFLIMDIEGAEYDALLGARQTIAEFRPVLAICAYHTQDHLWTLPLLIHDMLPEYNMYLRTYEGDGWQAVVYAVPKQRVRIG